MKRFGLTGGIASGKSAVAGMLREMGFHVIDADALGHEVIEPGRRAFEEIKREFGEGLIGADGRIDRGKLGAVVFADRAKLERLNAIVHPRVEEEMVRKFSEWEKSGVKDAAFVEAALLVEAGYQKNLDGLVVVWCRPEQQLERLLARGLSEGEARRRIAAQMPAEEKLKYATEKIDCSGTLEDTRRQVGELAERLRRGKAGNV
ncbi:MAG TPA: dephospho-CoA kinase [Candidatus Acidoferrum sp.]|jgi:dephospho-CoA kinase|nr:dephospho-CoA kinase [Candidatus Acidoferrum sp.]